MTDRLIKRTRQAAWPRPANPFSDFDQMLAGFFRPVERVVACWGASGWTPCGGRTRETEGGVPRRSRASGARARTMSPSPSRTACSRSQGERKVEEESDDKSYRRIERRYGAFSRSFNLPNVRSTPTRSLPPSSRMGC